MIDIRCTAVEVTGCIILMQFAARLTRPGGHLFHEAVGEALQMLHLKLKVKAVGIEGTSQPLVKILSFFEATIAFEGMGRPREFRRFRKTHPAEHP